jgi:hypothetical protein
VHIASNVGQFLGAMIGMAIANFKWWLGAGAAAAIALYFFGGSQSSKPSYQPSTYTPSTHTPYQPRQSPTYQPNPHPTYQPSPQPAYQPGTRPAPSQPELLAPTPPQSIESSNGLADHGRGRVACDVQWADSYKQRSQSTTSDYQDFIRKCMGRAQ